MMLTYSGIDGLVAALEDDTHRRHDRQLRSVQLTLLRMMQPADIHSLNSFHFEFGVGMV